MEQMKNGNYIKDLNTTFEESLEGGFYLIGASPSYKDSHFITKDGQYTFWFFSKEPGVKINSHKQNYSYGNYSLEESVDGIQGHYWMKTDTSYIDIEDWKSQVFTKADLQNPQKLIEFITKQSINNVLSKK